MQQNVIISQKIFTDLSQVLTTTTSINIFGLKQWTGGIMIRSHLGVNVALLYAEKEKML
jgi:hypothetical protein